MKKVIFMIIIILILILLLFTFKYKANNVVIDAGFGKLTKEAIKVFNGQFEDFYGINNSEDIKTFLQRCMKNYCGNDDKFRIPLIKFLKNNDEIILEYDTDKDFYIEKAESEYYIGLQNILESIVENKSYKVEFKYSTIIIGNVSLIREIDITECDETPRKFDLKDLENNRRYVEEKPSDIAYKVYGNELYVVELKKDN